MAESQEVIEFNFQKDNPNQLVNSQKQTIQIPLSPKESNVSVPVLLSSNTAGDYDAHSSIKMSNKDALQSLQVTQEEDLRARQNKNQNKLIDSAKNYTQQRPSIRKGERGESTNTIDTYDLQTKNSNKILGAAGYGQGSYDEMSMKKISMTGSAIGEVLSESQMSNDRQNKYIRSEPNLDAIPGRGGLKRHGSPRTDRNGV